MTTPATHHRWLARYALAALMIEAALVALVSLETPFAPAWLFLSLQAVAGVGFVFAVIPAWRGLGGARAAWFLIAAGVVFRATLLPFDHADDMHRYLWEGSIQHHGVNPFAVPPIADELVPLRDDAVYPGVNHKEHVAIYPPLAQLLFRGLAAVRVDFRWFKVVFTLFDLLTAAGLVVLLRRRGNPITRVVVYAWCPLVLFSVAGRGHVDTMQTCLAVWAIVATVSGRVGVAGLLLGAAIMSKTLAIVLVPAFVLHERRPWRLWPIVLPFALYGLYAGAGDGLVQSLWMFGREWSTNAFVYPLVTAIGGRPLVYAVAAITLAIALLRSRTVEDAAFVAWGVFLVFSPTFHPWYFLGIAPYLALRWRPAWMLLSMTLFLYYSFLSAGEWTYVDWVPWLEFAPFFVLLALGAARRGQTRRNPGSPSHRPTA